MVEDKIWQTSDVFAQQIICSLTFCTELILLLILSTPFQKDSLPFLKPSSFTSYEDIFNIEIDHFQDFPQITAEQSVLGE